MATIGSLADEASLLAAQGDPASLARAAGLLGEIKRRTDAMGIEVAGRLVSLWQDDDTRAAVRALGERSVAMVVQVYAGLDRDEAIAWTRLGSALRPQISLLGETLPARHAAVTDALGRGELRVSGADRVLAAVEQIEPHSSFDEREAVERFLVGEAPKMTDRQFARVCAGIPVTFQPENQAQRESLLRSKCGVWVRQREDGITETTIRSTGAESGLILAALDAQTAPRRRVALVPTDDAPGTTSGREAGETPVAASDAATGEPDRRPLSAKRLDAVIAMVRRMLGDDHGRVAGTSVTMRVTVGLAELQSGLGEARVDGLDLPISAADARRLAADAAIIPVVLGGPSAVLDQGRAIRLATESQRDALAVRDQGCIWPSCEMPPGWCEVAHVIPWVDGGPTDLSNGTSCKYALTCYS